MLDYLSDLGRPDRTGPGLDPGRPGVTVLVPTYSPAGGDRSRTLRRCVASLLAAAGDLPVALLVVDDGLSAPARADLAALLAATGGPSLVVTAAGGGTGPRRRYTAAAARNAGLAALAALPATAPMRRRHLLFLDDDTALAPDALAALVSALDRRPRAVAACPQVVPVADPDAWLAGPRPATRPEPRRLPGPIRDGRYDLLRVTSHGSLVTGRTVGLLVRQAPVLDRVRRRGPLFFEGTPYGSSEDMLCMAVLAGLGELWAVPSARVADEVRASPGSTRAQQFAWGYDHAWLAGALAGPGGPGPGVHVLSWCADGWQHDRLDWGDRTGFLVNPDEVRLAYRMLRAVTAVPATGRALFGAEAGAVTERLDLLGDVLSRWQAGVGGPVRRHREALPPLAGRDWDSLRDGVDALLGHLAGNVAGSTGSHFLYGARQPAPPGASAPAGPSTPIDRSGTWSTTSA